MPARRSSCRSSWRASACAFAGLCYAEFASLIPIAGSAYTYGYATLGEIFAWIIGWDLILEYAFGAATVASGWSGYVAQLPAGLWHPHPAAADGNAAARKWCCTTATGSDLGGPFRACWTRGHCDPATLPHITGAYFNLVAFLAICLVTVILVIGIKESANFNSAIVIIKVAIVLVFIGMAAALRAEAPVAPFGELASVHSAQTGELRALRLVGDCARRCGDLLRLHRL